MIAPNEQLAGNARTHILHLTTRDEAETAINELAQAENNRRKLIARMDEAILKIKDAHAPGIAECDAYIAERGVALEVWAEQNPKEFPKDKKSIDFAAGRVGFRKDTPSLALLNRSFNWGKVLVTLTKKKFRKLIRVKSEVDKEAVLARCGTLEKPTPFQVSILPSLGLKVVQGEKFFVETNLTDTEVRK